MRFCSCLTPCTITRSQCVALCHNKTRPKSSIGPSGIIAAELSLRNHSILNIRQKTHISSNNRQYFTHPLNTFQLSYLSSVLNNKHLHFRPTLATWIESYLIRLMALFLSSSLYKNPQIVVYLFFLQTGNW